MVDADLPSSTFWNKNGDPDGFSSVDSDVLCDLMCLFFKSLTDFFSEANRRDILSDARLLDVLLEMPPRFGHTFDA